MKLNDRLRRWSKVILDRAEWLHILASVVTILSLFVALHTFKAQISLQSQDQQRERLAQVSALRAELGEIAWTMNRYIGLTTNDMTNIYHHFFPIENLREATHTGWLGGGGLGPDIIRVYQLINRENFHLTIENSPEYVLTQPENWLDRKSAAMKRRQEKLPELKAIVVALDGKLEALQLKWRTELGEQPAGAYGVPAAAQP